MHSVSTFESKQHQHRRGLSLSLSSSIAGDRDEDLTLFRDMRRREQERKVSIPEEPGMQTPRTAGNKSLDHSLHRTPASSIPINGFVADDLFSSDFGKNDYDWLMTPPSTPLFLPVDGDSRSRNVSYAGAASARSSLKTSKLGNSNTEPSFRAEHSSKNVHCHLGLQQTPIVNLIGSPLSMSAKPVLSGVPRSSTQGFNPAARHSTASPAHVLRHVPMGAISSSRPSSSLASTGLQPTMQNGGIRTVTPSAARLTVPSCRSACSSRPSTPVKRSPSPSHPCNLPTTLVRCSSASRASSMLSKGATLSRPSSTSKACFPEALQGFSQERPANLRTSMPERSLSNSRGSTSKTIHFEQSDPVVRGRRHSGSSVVARGSSSTAMQNGYKATHLSAEVDGNAADMQVVNGCGSKFGVKAECSLGGQSLVLDPHVHKLARSTPLQNVKTIFASLRESSIVNQNSSKRSLDLTPRHKDACKGTPQKFRSFMSSISKPRSMGRQEVKGSCNKATHTKSSVMDSPMATSSCTSSEHNMSIVIDPEGSELGDESVSEKGSRSSAASQHDLFLFSKEKRISSWLRSPDYREDDDADIMQIFEQEGLESLSGLDSPLIIDLDGTIDCDNFCLDPI